MTNTIYCATMLIVLDFTVRSSYGGLTAYERSSCTLDDSLLGMHRIARVRLLTKGVVSAFGAF